MNTLRQAVQEYLAMRRSLGFKLHSAGPALLDFVSFLEQQRVLYHAPIGSCLGQTSLGRTTRYAGGAAFELCAPLCALSKRH